MAKNTPPTESTDAANQSAPHTEPLNATEAPVTPQAHAGRIPHTREASRSRWVLTSLAAAGLLCLGLLGGMLIGQNFMAPGSHNDAGPGKGFIHQGEPGQQQIPERRKEHLKNEVRNDVKERLQERRDQRQHAPGTPQEQPSDPGQTPPDNGAPNDGTQPDNG